jgi:hypothetical protein
MSYRETADVSLWVGDQLGAWLCACDTARADGSGRNAHVPVSEPGS